MPGQTTVGQHIYRAFISTIGILLVVSPSTICLAYEIPSIVRAPENARISDEKDDSPARPSLYAIHIYQRFVSPLLGPRCNFRPSCSRYSSEAIQKYGIIRGLIMTAERLMRCHYCAGFYYQRKRGLLVDPVADNLAGSAEQ